MELPSRIPEKMVENYCFFGASLFLFSKEGKYVPTVLRQIPVTAVGISNLKSQKESVEYFGILKVCLYGMCVIE
jgi:hypothetical protein